MKKVCACESNKSKGSLTESVMPEGDKLKREIERKKAERRKQSSQLMKWVIVLLVALMLSSSLLALLLGF